MTRAELEAVVEATGCAEEVGGFVLLRDPEPSEAERSAVQAVKARIAKGVSAVGKGWLGVRTGGSSGGVKFARHDEVTLAAAVGGFVAHFGLERVNAVDVLPPYHVSGFMARVRCAASGGEHVAWGWPDLAAGKMPALRGKDWVISLVPTQLHRLLSHAAAVDWLRQLRVIFVGGGPVWPQLADAAAQAGLRVSLSYGMTETAAMVAASRPEDFLAGDRSCGLALPHAEVRVDENGLIVITGESVCGGFLAADGSAQCHAIRDIAAGARRTFVTQDLGRIDEHGRLHVLGRSDAVIITGGKKVQPQDVEAALRASGEFEDVAVFGIADPEWGQAVVACYLRGARLPNVLQSVRALSPYQRPKHWIALEKEEWPRNAHGKVNRAALAERAKQGRVAGE